MMTEMSLKKDWTVLLFLFTLAVKGESLQILFNFQYLVNVKLFMWYNGQFLRGK